MQLVLGVFGLEVQCDGRSLRSIVDGFDRVDALTARHPPGGGLIIFEPQAKERRVGGDGGGGVEVGVVGGPPKRGAQIGELGGEPGVRLPLSRAVPQGHDFVFAPGEVAGMRGPHLVASPLATSCPLGELADRPQH